MTESFSRHKMWYNRNPIFTLKDTISFVPSLAKTLEKKNKTQISQILKQNFVGKRIPKKEIKVRSFIERK